MVPYGGRRDPRSRQGGQEPEQGQPAQVMEQDHRHHRPEQGPLFYTIVFCFAQMQAVQAAANITDKIATSAPTSQPTPPTVQPSVSGPMLLERKDRCYSSLLTANVAACDRLVLGRYVIEDGGERSTSFTSPSRCLSLRHHLQTSSPCSSTIAPMAPHECM